MKKAIEQRKTTVKDIVDAAKTGDIDKLNKLITDGFDFKALYKFKTALEHVVELGLKDAVSALLKAGADTDLISTKKLWSLLRLDDAVQIIKDGKPSQAFKE